jgi:hypothetical protein
MVHLLLGLQDGPKGSYEIMHFDTLRSGLQVLYILSESVFLTMSAKMSLSILLAEITGSVQIGLISEHV